MPVFRKTFYDIALATSAQDMAGMLRYAQALGATENSIIRFGLDTKNGSYWLSQKRADEEDFSRVIGRFGRTFYLPQEITMESKASGIYFYPGSNAESARISLINPNQKKLNILVSSRTGQDVSITDNAR